MRVTRELLIRHAKENAARLAANNRGLICVYLAGSLLRDDPFLGGVTDIDLMCVHDRPVKIPREIVRINADVHLDIAHFQQDDFEPARKLRTDAWIGGQLEAVPLVLHDSLRWYDFTRAGATAQFWSPENVAQRVRSFLVPARGAWSDLQDEAIPQGIKRTQAYILALRNLANGVAVLNGMPLPTRRMLIDLPDRASQAGLYSFAGDFVQLFTSSAVNDDNFARWLLGFKAVFDTLEEHEDVPVAIHPDRRNYFEKAVLALSVEHPAAAVWILLRTWTKAIAFLPKSGQPYFDWQALCKQLEIDGKHLPARLESLDHLLDSAEEAVDRLQG